MIATARWDSNARLWNAATGKQLAVLTGHTDAVLNCVFSPDGWTLATKSDDGTIKFWNLATFRDVCPIQMGYAGEIAGAFPAFSPDGQILTANGNGSGLRYWGAPTLAEIDAAEAKQMAENKQP
jgi:WD40 repeat protein